ncbi:hypothetical protein RI054_22g97020 [Pseudoscourfieldia marina]
MSRKIKDDHARVTLQRQKEMKRIAEHQLSGEIATTLQDESELSELDYRKQGNLDAYTTEAINMRRRLRADTDVGNRINRWWCHFNRPAGRLFFEVDAYVYMHIVLDHAVNGNEFATDEELIADAAVDWLEDAESKTAIVYDVFFNAIYELADLWTHSVEKVEYIEFLERALDDCRKMEESCTDAMRRRMQQLAKATKDRVIAEEFGELSWIRNFAKIGGGLYVDEYGQRLRRSEKHYMCNVVDGVALYDNHGRPLFDSLGRPIHYVDSTGMSKAFLTDDCGALYNAKGYKVDANGVKAKKAKKMGGSWSISKDVCPRSRSRKDLLTLGFHVGEDGELYRHDGSDPVGLTVGDDGKMRDAFGRVVVKGADGRWYDENGNLLYDENGNSILIIKQINGASGDASGRVLVRGADGCWYDENGNLLNDENGNSHHFDDSLIGGPPGLTMGADGKMRDASGRVLVRGADGRWYDENGNLLYGENGNPINNTSGLTMGADGKMRDASGRVLVRGADGRWYDENGNLLYGENGNPINNTSGLTMGADGKMRDASGRVLVRGADGRWYDENGNLLYGENGNPINDKTTRGSKHRAAHRGMHHQSKVANARTRKDGMDSLPAIENGDLIFASQWDLSIRDVTMTSKLQRLGRKFSEQKQARIRKILRKDVPERTRDLPEKSANQHTNANTHSVVPPLTNLPQIADASRAAANDAGAAAPSLPMSSRMEDFSMPSLPPIGAPALSARFSTKPRAGGWSKIRERRRIASAMVRGKSNNDVGANAPPPPSFEVGAAGSGFTWREKGGVQVAHEPPAAPTIGSFHASPSLRAGILETSARAVRILQHSDLNLGLSY